MKTNARKMYLAVSGGIAALGIVLAGVGFAISGFDPAVFTSTVDLRADKVVLGGTEVDDYDDLLVAGILDTIGSVDISAAEAPDSPDAPSAPEAPTAPEAPAEPEEPAAPEAPSQSAAPASSEE